MAKQRKQPSSRGARKGKAQVAVSRIEQHHVDAFTELGADWADRATSLLRSRSEGTGFGLAVTVDGEAAGLVGVRFGEPWELHDLHVHPDRRGQGIGTRLVTAVEEFARLTGSLRVTVGVDNHDARRLVQRLGYQATGELQTSTYTHLDDDGTPHQATETDEAFLKRF